MNVWGITHRGVVREENQDAFAVQSLSEHEALAVVCDGMGGARAGNVASALTVDIFLDGLLQDLREGETLGGVSAVWIMERLAAE